MTDDINPYIEKRDDELFITEAGKELLQELVTDPHGNVYAFTPRASPLLVAAAMARLSRSPNDLRKTYLNEFAIDPRHAENLIDRVVAGYGDDSVQQLFGMHIVVENASNLLTKKLEWGRFLSYLEQSTRYIFFDQKINGAYRYYVPDHLPNRVKHTYAMLMDNIFTHYSQMVRDLTEYLRKKHANIRRESGDVVWKNTTRAQACDAVRPTLPAATTSTVGIYGSSQGIESLIIHLLSEEIPEFRKAGEDILREAGKVAPSFMKRAGMENRGLVTARYLREKRKAIRELADQEIRGIPSGDGKVALIDYWPTDELDLVPEMLFSETNQPLSEIRKKTANWTDEEKSRVFDAYIGIRQNRRHKPGRALEKVHYEWEIVGDYGTFRDLQRHRVVDSWEWQRLTPCYGYCIPSLISEAGMEETFKKCFLISEALYHYLCNAGFEEEAQYATLLGHNMQYRFLLNARAAFHFLELRSQPAGHPGYRSIVTEMHRQLSQVHPRIGSAMTFINKEDVHLSRLEAEKATQEKLNRL